MVFLRKRKRLDLPLQKKKKEKEQVITCTEYRYYEDAADNSVRPLELIQNNLCSTIKEKDDNGSIMMLKKESNNWKQNIQTKNKKKKKYRVLYKKGKRNPNEGSVFDCVTIRFKMFALLCRLFCCR